MLPNARCAAADGTVMLSAGVTHQAIPVQPFSGLLGATDAVAGALVGVLVRECCRGRRHRFVAHRRGTWTMRLL